MTRGLVTIDQQIDFVVCNPAVNASSRITRPTTAIYSGQGTGSGLTYNGLY
jgi:hypothetical protein